MYMLTVVLKSTAQVVTLHFNKFDDAKKNMEKIVLDVVIGFNPVADDYGGVGAFTSDQIAAVFITDLDQEMKALEIKEIAKQNTIRSIQRASQNDPVNRIAMPGAGSPLRM